MFRRPNGNAIGSIVINNLRDSVVSNGYDEIMFCVDCSEVKAVAPLVFSARAQSWSQT